MVIVGVSTCAYPDLSLTSALERIAALAPAAEVRCKGRHGIATMAQRLAVASCGMRCSVHAPGQIEIWSSDERQRRVAVACHERLLEACADTQVELYVVHPDSSESPTAMRAETRTALQRSFADLHALEGTYPVRSAVENMPSRRNPHVIAPRFDLGGLRWALDVGHALTNGMLEEFLDDADIAHLHLHDNRGFGSPDLHLPLGRGCLSQEVTHGVLNASDDLCVLEHASELQVRESLDFLRRLQPGREVA